MSEVITIAPADDNPNKDVQKSVRNAVTKRATPRLITDNLDQEFSNIVHQKNSPDYYAKQLSTTFGTPYGAGVKKHAGRRATASYTVDRVFEAPHNPFRNRLAVETPSNIVENYQRFRYYFKYEPLVGTAIELHAEFPMSEFELKHEDPTLQQEFNDISYDLNLFDFMLDMAVEYWLIGECFPFGIFDDPKQPTAWNGFVLLNPLAVDVSSVELTDGRPNTIMRLRISEAIKKVVENGPRHPETGPLYNRIPEDIKRSVKGDGFLKLNEQQVSHFKRKGNYFKTRGESLLYRIIHLLNYRDKLRDAQYSIADRHVTPRELWKVGETDNPATDEELSNLAAILSQTYNDPNQAIIYHHAVTCDVIGTADKVLPLRQELDGIEEEMLIGLMLNKGFLDSNYGAYANMSVALDVLISRYLTFRQRVERWQAEAVWTPLCRIHNIYKPTPAELSHRIRVKNNDKTPWVPKITWTKHEMRDNTQKVNLLLTLREKLGNRGAPGFPRDRILQYVNENPKDIKKQLDKEAKEDAVAKGNINLGGGSGSAGAPPGGAGMGGGLPDLSVDTSNLGGGAGGKADLSKMKDSDLPEFGAPSGGGEPGPPESQSIQNQNSPTS